MNLEAMNEKALKKYIKQTPTQTDRSNLLFLIPVFPIFFIAIPLIAHPFHLFYLLLFVPFILLDVWVLIYRFSKAYHSKKQDLQFYLMRGIFGLCTSFGCFLASQKFAYTMLTLDTPWFFILTFLGYLLVLFSHFKTRVDKLKEMPNKGKKQNKGQQIAVASGSVAFGSLVYSLFLRDASENITSIILIIILLIFSAIVMHFILDLHKYMVIKTHIKKGEQI